MKSEAVPVEVDRRGGDVLPGRLDGQRLAGLEDSVAVGEVSEADGSTRAPAASPARHRVSVSACGVKVGGPGVGVRVGVEVTLGVKVIVRVGVRVTVGVTVRVAVAVPVDVAVRVGVCVTVAVRVRVKVGVFVGGGMTYWKSAAHAGVWQAVHVAQVPLLAKISIGVPIVFQALTTYLTTVAPDCAGIVALTTSTVWAEARSKKEQSYAAVSTCVVPSPMPNPPDGFVPSVV